MIKDLKKRFVLITMSLLTVVLVGVLSVISIISYQRLNDDGYRMLERIVEQPDVPFRPTIEREAGDPQVMPLAPAFSVEVDANGNFISGRTEDVQIDSETLNLAIKSAFESQSRRGTIHSPALIFLKKTLPNGHYRIAFADRRNHLASHYALIRNLVLIGILTLLIFWIISLYLAGLAVAPIEAAWIRQKEFIADASHELKTPLTVILTNLGILSASPNQSITSQKKWIENSRAEAGRMKELLEQMLFLARSDNGSLPESKEVVNFSELVQEAILTMEPLAFECGLQINERLTSDISVLGNSGQLKQLIRILLDNACKYAPRNTAINISLISHKKKLSLTVSNQGEPISTEDLSKIFDRFFRIDKSRVRKTGGYGLGLSIAQKIVHSHKGTIHAQSDIPNGTSFTVELPKSEELRSRIS